MIKSGFVRHNLKSFQSIMELSEMSFGDGRGEVTGGAVSILPWIDRLEFSMSNIRHVRGSNYIQMATVDEKNLPSCRTVVFRGLLKHSNPDINIDQIALKIITDSRSEKIRHFGLNPHSELVWWMPLTSEQYRFNSRIELVSSSHTDEQLLYDRNNMWENLSDAARKQFFWPDPGTVYSHYASSNMVGLNDTSTPPDNFMLLLAYPRIVQYLRLTDNLCLTDILTEGGQWNTTRVNP